MAVVDIVIVNWNSGSHLRDCVRALASSTTADSLDVVIVDNASTDRSSDNLPGGSLAVRVIANPDNRGFAAASNQGASLGESPYILLLNPDVTVTPDAISHATRWLDQPANANVGVAGIRLVDQRGQTRRGCARRPTAAQLLLRTFFIDRIAPAWVPPHFLVEWDHADTRPVDQVIGAFLLIRRPLFERLGGLDERFFLYYEDLDLCVRVLDAGRSVVHLADAVAMHVGEGTTQAVKDRRFCYEATSRVVYAAKWHGRAMSVALVFLICFVEIPLRLAHATIRGSTSDLKWIARGARQYWRGLPNLFRRIGHSGTCRIGG